MRVMPLDMAYDPISVYDEGGKAGFSIQSVFGKVNYWVWTNLVNLVFALRRSPYRSREGN